MQKIIDQIGFTEHDVFVDLGSGVGQLITYVAGATRVRSLYMKFEMKKAFLEDINRLSYRKQVLK